MFAFYRLVKGIDFIEYTPKHTNNRRSNTKQVPEIKQSGIAIYENPVISFIFIMINIICFGIFVYRPRARRRKHDYQQKPMYTHNTIFILLLFICLFVDLCIQLILLLPDHSSISCHLNQKIHWQHAVLFPFLKKLYFVVVVAVCCLVFFIVFFFSIFCVNMSPLLFGHMQWSLPLLLYH